MSENQAVCIYCGDTYSNERYELGYDYCMKPKCTVAPLQDAMKDYRFILVPKQGFTYVKADSEDLKMNTKSSGR